MHLYISNKFTLILIILIFNYASCNAEEEEESEDLYELLGVSRTADTKEIRQAFKKLAVKFHPDKNKDDKEANSQFVKIARAYEVLRDPDTRKHYDLLGDDSGIKYKKQTYHSYTYYRDQFGIYDDDPLVITLNRADFELNVVDNSHIWFVNFYSAQCHHCHELAPTWRKLAVEFEGIIRIAAVNCEEDWSLCHQLNIGSYPTLLIYGKDANLYEGEKYFGSRTFEDLNTYVLSHITENVKIITPKAWVQDGLKTIQWLLLLCPDDNALCPESETKKKLAAIFEGLMPVGLITDSVLSKEISEKYRESPVVFWQVTNDNVDIHNVEGTDAKEIVENVLKLIPDPPLMTEEDFREARNSLRSDSETPWLICFYMGPATDLNLQLKRLPIWLSNINMGLIHCGRNSQLCSSLHVNHYPTWGVLKVGGAFELHHGRDILHEIVAFGRDSSKSTNLHALSPAEFYSFVKQGSDSWFIDWYAPWCPPCKKLIPEMRKASLRFSSERVKFGTIDCTLHGNLCSNEDIRAYPTTRLYNGSQIHNFFGVPNEQGIVEFIENMLHPYVLTLDGSSFAQLMIKPAEEIWIVDYYVPWCGPCQTLKPQWHALAKQISHLNFIQVAQVDCVENADLCTAQNIRSYPTIRLYPLGSKGLNTVAIYNGYFETRHLKQWVLSFLPSPVENLTPEKFQKEILTIDKEYIPWIIDFFAPWCGHCTTFEPEFITVAQKLEGKVRSGKMDCEMNKPFCREQHVRSYPTVLLYTSPSTRHEINSQISGEILNEVDRLLKHSSHEEL